MVDAFVFYTILLQYFSWKTMQVCTTIHIKQYIYIYMQTILCIYNFYTCNFIKHALWESVNDDDRIYNLL